MRRRSDSTKPAPPPPLAPHHRRQLTAEARPPVCIVSKAGRAVKVAPSTLVRAARSRHVHMRPFAAHPRRVAPSFLWRFWPPLPAGWHDIFDRSWYGRVLSSESKTSLRRAMAPRLRRDQRLRTHVGRRGMIVIKLWMHLSHEEQLRASNAAATTRSSLGIDRRGLAEPRKAAAIHRGVNDMLA